VKTLLLVALVALFVGVVPVGAQCTNPFCPPVLGQPQALLTSNNAVQYDPSDPWTYVVDPQSYPVPGAPVEPISNAQQWQTTTLELTSNVVTPYWIWMDFGSGNVVGGGLAGLSSVPPFATPWGPFAMMADPSLVILIASGTHPGGGTITIAEIPTPAWPSNILGTLGIGLQGAVGFGATPSPILGSLPPVGLTTYLYFE